MKLDGILFSVSCEISLYKFITRLNGRQVLNCFPSWNCSFKLRYCDECQCFSTFFLWGPIHATTKWLPCKDISMIKKLEAGETQLAYVNEGLIVITQELNDSDIWMYKNTSLELLTKWMKNNSLHSHENWNNQTHQSLFHII